MFSLSTFRVVLELFYQFSDVSITTLTFIIFETTESPWSSDYHHSIHPAFRTDRVNEVPKLRGVSYLLENTKHTYVCIIYIIIYLHDQSRKMCNISSDHSTSCHPIPYIGIHVVHVLILQNLPFHGISKLMHNTYLCAPYFVPSPIPSLANIQYMLILKCDIPHFQWNHWKQRMPHCTHCHPCHPSI